MNFFKAVYNIIANIPSGQVATYGQIAGLISTPRAARAVGFALNALPPNTKLPWQRIINSQGRISIDGFHFTADCQARLLRQEGIKVIKRDHSYFIDLQKYLWQP